MTEKKTRGNMAYYIPTAWNSVGTRPLCPPSNYTHCCPSYWRNETNVMLLTKNGCMSSLGRACHDKDMLVIVSFLEQICAISQICTSMKSHQTARTDVQSNDRHLSRIQDKV